ncbi:MAG: AAA family ATPase, partial [Alistipes sp.]|nr:AAA family ATPase [Alistipes sp.]
MAEAKKAYVCRECGYDAPKWLGKCPSCGAWNTFDELVVAKKGSSVAAAVTSSAVPKAKPQKVQDIKTGETKRIDVGQSEVNRVLGGGLVPGSVILVGGEPGIGKSTLALQLALADNNLRTLYVSGEESAEQIKMRAERLGIHNEDCVVYTETLLENIVAQCEAIKPDMVVVDLIQTIYTDLVDASAGSVS